MTTPLTRLTAEQLKEANAAVQLLTGTLKDAALQLPSVTVDWHPSWITGTVLVDLGRAPAHVVIAMAGLIREGLNARVQQSH